MSEEEAICPRKFGPGGGNFRGGGKFPVTPGSM